MRLVWVSLTELKLRSRSHRPDFPGEVIQLSPERLMRFKWMVRYVSSSSDSSIR